MIAPVVDLTRNAAQLRPVRSGAQPGATQSSVSELAPLPALLAPERPPGTDLSPTVTPVLQQTTYVVKRGDELRNIAARYGVSLGSILALNTIANPDSLTVGQELVMPAASGQ